MQVTHDEHYVPQMYLKRFSVNKQCYVMYKQGDIKRRSIKGICYDEDLYELTSKTGEIVNQNLYENDLFGKIETEYQEYFDEFIKTLDEKTFNRFMDGNNIKKLMLWLTSMLLRNKHTMGMTKEVGAEIGIEWSDSESRNNAILHNSLLVEHNTEKLFSTHKVVVLKNQSEIGFVTSDFPVLIIPCENGNPRWGMPLNDRYYVLLVDKRDRNKRANSIIDVNTFIVDFYNKLMIHGELCKYAISKDRESLERYKARGKI